MTLAIIGSAGRGPDGERFAKERGLWRTMRAVSQIAVGILKPDCLVSGGAAVSDHLAVQLYLEGAAPQLHLHLPAEWTGYGFKETSSKYDCGRTSNWYHSQWSKTQTFNSLEQIQQAIEKGAVIKTGAAGFKERNTDIANEADVLLAFTFGDGGRLKPGGTKDTWDKYLARRVNIMNTAEAPSWEGYPNILRAYHFCLNTKKLYSL